MELDHLAVSGVTLEDACGAVETALGVRMQAGGHHPLFGTHNTLLALDGGLYIEAIAIDPQAPAPTRPRWFDLDCFTGPAALTNWICRTDDLIAELAGTPCELGTPIALSRGDLRWSMAVPESGRLPYDNLHPALIQWQGDLHPGTMLEPRGCALRRLTIAHPDAKVLQSQLPLNDARVVFEVGPAAMMAEIQTPGGMRVLQ